MNWICTWPCAAERRLRKIGDRCDLLHQKDLPGAVTPVNVYETLGETAEVTCERFREFSRADLFAEVGEGVIDIPSIIADVRKLGHGKYMFVEQDHTTKNQLKSVEISYRNMAKLFEAN